MLPLKFGQNGQIIIRLDYVLDIISTLKLNRIIERDLNRSLDLNLPNSTEIVKAIDDGHLQTAMKLIEDILENKLSEHQRRQAKLIEKALDMGQATKFIHWQQAKNQLAALIFEYAYRGSQLQGEIDPRPWWYRWQWWSKPTNFNTQQQAYLELYWFYQIIQARENKNLKAWEGIRLVRERESRKLYPDQKKATKIRRKPKKK